VYHFANTLSTYDASVCADHITQTLILHAA